MSLRSLLPIGRTFEPSGERPGRFRPAVPGLLPDFSRTLREGPGDPVDADVAGGRLDATSAPEMGVGLVREEWEAQRVVSGVSRVVVGPRAVVAGRGGRRLPVWLEQIILMVVRPGNRRRGTRPEQSEFCLQSVKVAKNDLVTADVEVVAVRSSLSKPQALSASCRARLLALWWAPVARRLGRLGNRTS